MCELILNDASDSRSSGFSVQTSVNPYLSLKPLVEVLSRGEKDHHQVNNHYAGTHRVVNKKHVCKNLKSSETFKIIGRR